MFVLCVEYFFIPLSCSLHFGLKLMMCHLKMALGSTFGGLRNPSTSNSAVYECVCDDDDVVHVRTKWSKRNIFIPPAWPDSLPHKRLHCFGKIYLSHSNSLTHPLKTRISTKREGKRCFSVRLFFFARDTLARMNDAKSRKKRCWAKKKKRASLSWDRRLGKRSCAQIENIFSSALLLFFFSVCDIWSSLKVSGAHFRALFLLLHLFSGGTAELRRAGVRLMLVWSFGDR